MIGPNRGQDLRAVRDKWQKSVGNQNWVIEKEIFRGVK